MRHIVKILEIEEVTHDVKRFVVEKPENYKFIPGQATNVSINKPKWKNEERPFTFTCLNEYSYLEFVIKCYKNHKGVTNELNNLVVRDELIIRDVWGTINYTGKGVFIAGGAGITPFIAILRQLKKDNELNGNRLIFSNKTSKDIILEKEFKQIFKDKPRDLIFTLTNEKNPNYYNRLVDEEFLREIIYDFNQNFYVCGPPRMINDIKKILKKLGAKINLIIFEK